MFMYTHTYTYKYTLIQITTEIYLKKLFMRYRQVESYLYLLY